MERQSNIELLRIISMFLVLVVHYIPTRGLVTSESIQSDFLQSLFTLELNSLSFVCVNCFVLISGYFRIKWKKKSLLNLFFQIFFWIILSGIISYLFFDNFSLKTALYNIYGRWFIRCYLLLFLFAPILNSFIEYADKKVFAIFLVLFYFSSTLLGWILQVSPEFSEGMTFVSLIGLYLIGAFISKYNITFFGYNKNIDLLLYFILGLGLVIIQLLALKLGMNSSIYGYLNPIVILQSVYLFLFFTKCNFVNKWVNWIASSSFAVYLFHTDRHFYHIFLNNCRLVSKMWGGVFCYLLLVFIISVLLDRIRVYIYNKCIVKIIR